MTAPDTDTHRADPVHPDRALCGAAEVPPRLLALRDIRVTCEGCKRIIAGGT